MNGDLISGVKAKQVGLVAMLRIGVGPVVVPLLKATGGADSIRDEAIAGGS